MVTIEKLKNAMAYELEAVDRWKRQADTAEATRREDLLEAYRHNSRAGVFADILRKDFNQDPGNAAEVIRSNAAGLEDLLKQDTLATTETR